MAGATQGAKAARMGDPRGIRKRFCPEDFLLERPCFRYTRGMRGFFSSFTAILAAEIAACVAMPGFAGPGVSDPDNPIDFETQIRPIFEQRCYECHGANKQKGRLRLDQRASVFRGEDHEDWRIIPGDPEESEVFHRISLPADDFDIMPPEGDPLTAEQIALIRQWIAEGAEWPEGAHGEGALEVERIEIRELSPAEEEAERAAIARVAERGGLIMPIAEDTRALYLNLSLLAEPFEDADMKLLRGLEPTLVWLNLGRSQITDAGVRELERFAELRRVHLNGTDVGDAAMASLAKLERLRFLNLYGTNVTDAGATRLAGLNDLRKVFLWQTEVTEEAAARLREANPNLQIDLGNYALAAPVPEEAAQPAAEMTCCETALANGQLCVHTCCVEALAKDALCAKCNPNGGEELLAKIQALAEELKKKDGDG